MTSPQNDPLLDLAADALALYRLAYSSDTQEAQWQPGHTIVPRNETGIRASNLVNDPTATAALDPRRLELRQAVIEAERALARVQSAVRESAALLEAKLSAMRRDEG